MPEIIVPMVTEPSLTEGSNKLDAEPEASLEVGEVLSEIFGDSPQPFPPATVPHDARNSSHD